MSDIYSSPDSSPPKPERPHTAPTQLPDWELPQEYKPGDTAKRRRVLPTLTPSHHSRFDGAKTFYRRNKKLCWAIAATLILALLALIIGLSVGLTRSNKAQNLPLPTNTAQHTGDLTYYDPGLGACGIVSDPSDSVVSVSHLIFDAVQVGGNPNLNILCGKKIRATREGRSMDLTVVDRCTGCQPNDLDTTTGVFDTLAEREQGRVEVVWAWLEVVPGIDGG